MSNNQRRGAIPPYLQQHKSGKYQPEYKRLDLEPVQPGLENTPNTPSNYVKAGVKRPLSPKHNVPPGRSLPAQVGNNEEQLWMDDSVIGGTPVKIKANQYIDNNDFVNTNIDDKNFTHLKKHIEEKQYENEPQYDEIEQELEDQKETRVKYYRGDEPKEYGHKQKQENQKQENTIVSALNETLTPGEYIVYYNEIIVKSYDPLEVRKAIEHLVINDVPLEDIFVCKRLSIDFGAILDNG